MIIKKVMMLTIQFNLKQHNKIHLKIEKIINELKVLLLKNNHKAENRTAAVKAVKIVNIKNSNIILKIRILLTF